MMNAHGFLPIDKPRGLTSHDVVARIRRLLRTRRAGHAGTLDPAAEGMLVVAVGGATRLIDQVQDAPKQYLAHVVLGYATDSADLEGAIVTRGSAAAPSRATVEQALAAFTGTIIQIPPAHSAIKVAGEALYRRARRGETFEVPPRTVTVENIGLLHFHFPDLFLRIDCGKGVYIRSIARDLGRALGTSAYLHALLRTRVGRFELCDAWPLSELERDLRPETWGSFAVHPDAVLTDLPALVLDGNASQAWYHGRPIPADGGLATSAPLARAYDWHGEWLGVASFEDQSRRWQPRQVIGRPGLRSE